MIFPHPAETPDNTSGFRFKVSSKKALYRRGDETIQPMGDHWFLPGNFDLDEKPPQARFSFALWQGLIYH
jgi:hypothetical protein